MSTQESTARKHAALGMSAGLIVGGALGLVFGIIIDNSPLCMTLGAGGGMVIGIAAGTALDRRESG